MKIFALLLFFAAFSSSVHAQDIESYYAFSPDGMSDDSSVLDWSPNIEIHHFITSNVRAESFNPELDLRYMNGSLVDAEKTSSSASFCLVHASNSFPFVLTPASFARITLAKDRSTEATVVWTGDIYDYEPRRGEIHTASVEIICQKGTKERKVTPNTVINAFAGSSSTPEEIVRIGHVIRGLNLYRSTHGKDK